jgi:PP-loop superfamily ATP-utilizing enzyme
VVRVRDLGSNRARVEVGSEEIGRLMVEADSTRAELRVLGFEEVILDERGYRSGALNERVVLEIGRR